LTGRIERLEAFIVNISEIVIIYQSDSMAELSTPLGDESGGELEFLTLLITLYRDHNELWQLRSKDYFNKNKKAKALQTIVDTLKPYKSDFTVEKLKQKINILRTNFNKCYKAIENKKRSGASVDDIPEPNVWYYNELLFIKDQVEITETQSSEVSKHQIYFIYLCV